MKISKVYNMFYKEHMRKHIMALIVLLFYCTIFFFIPMIIERVYNFAFINPDNSSLFFNVAIISGLYILVVLLDLQFERMMKDSFLWHPIEKVKEKTISKSFSIPIEYYYKNNPGTIYGNISANLFQGSQQFYSFVRDLSQIIKIIFSLIIILSINWFYAIIFIGVNLIFLTGNYFIARLEIKNMKEMQKIVGKSYSRLYDTLKGYFDISSNGFLEYFLRINKKAISEATSVDSKSNITFEIGFLVSAFVHKIAPVLVVAILYFINPEWFIISEFLGFYMIYLSIPEIKALIYIKQSIELVETSWKSVMEFLQLEEENYGNKIINSFKIKISNLSITLRERKLINNVSLEIIEGEKIIITGKSGEGKSVMMNSLFGNFYDKQGLIEIDGTEIKNINLIEYRKQISYIDTDPIIFDDSILENIILDTSANEKEIKQLIEKFELGKFFERFKGLHKIISHNTLSSGEKVVISFLRAIIRKPRIIFLDEATSSLDVVLEPLLLSKLKQVEATVIAISHKYSSAKHFDRIIHLENGKVVEDIHPSEIESSNYINEYFRQQLEAIKS